MDIYIKIKRISLFFTLFILFFSNSKAQETASYWQIDYAKGSIIEHSKLVSFLFKEHPTLLSVGWHKTASNTSVWKERYNFLDWGIVLNYQNFYNENLGSIIGLNYTTTHYLRNRNAKNQLTIQLGFGAGYNTAPLDFDNNLTNIVMSSNILFSQHTKVNYINNRLFQNMGFQAGITFTHFSNGAVKKPNLGLNSIFLNLGLNYLPTKPVIYNKFTEKEPLEKQPIHFFLSVAGGMHETLPQIGLQPVYYMSAQFSKRFNHKNGFHVGFDFFNSLSRKDLALYEAVNDIENPTNLVKDHKQLAFFAGHELFFNKLSFETRIGYYLYHPLQASAVIYELIALKKHFNNYKSAFSINLKTHYFEAEHITFGYHHQIF